MSWILFAAAGHLSLSAQTTGNAGEEYRRAEELVREHRWDDGLAALQPLLQSEPGNLKVINLAALALTGKGDIQQADEYFERALKLDSAFLPALKNLGINEFNANQRDKARSHLAEALKGSPDDPIVNLYLGQLYFEKGDFDSAAKTLSKAGVFFGRNPNLGARLAISYLATGEASKATSLLPSLPPDGLSSESQFLLGAKLAEAGLFLAAVPYLQSASSGNPNSYNASFDLALCYLNLKRYEEAAAVLRAAIDRGEETSELDSLLANAYESDKQTQQAVDSFRRAIALAPKDEGNYLDFASLCIDHQDFEAGLKVLNAGLQVSPNSDRLYFERAILHAMQDNFQLAEEDFQEVARLKPESNATYKGLGVLYLEAGDAAQAVRVLKARLREKPDDADLLYLWGEAVLRSGAHVGDPAYQEAQSAFQKSIKFDPRLSLPRVALGKMYLEQDRVSDAVGELEAARSADPKEKSTYWQLALAYKRSGQIDKQKEALNSLKILNDQERNGSHDRARAVQDSASKAAP